MPACDGSEPVADDELLYRRIPVSKRWYDESGLSPEAFDPRDEDKSGLSFYRGKYKTIQEVAKGLSKKGYFVAVLRAGELKEHGITIEPRPQAGDPGHAELPELTCDTRLTQEAQERKLVLAKLCIVEGPFSLTDESQR